MTILGRRQVPSPQLLKGWVGEPRGRFQEEFGLLLSILLGGQLAFRSSWSGCANAHVGKFGFGPGVARALSETRLKSTVWSRHSQDFDVFSLFFPCGRHAKPPRTSTPKSDKPPKKHQYPGTCPPPFSGAALLYQLSADDGGSLRRL